MKSITQAEYDELTAAREKLLSMGYQCLERIDSTSEKNEFAWFAPENPIVVVSEVKAPTVGPVDYETLLVWMREMRGEMSTKFARKALDLFDVSKVIQLKDNPQAIDLMARFCAYWLGRYHEFLFHPEGVPQPSVNRRLKMAEQALDELGWEWNEGRDAYCAGPKADTPDFRDILASLVHQITVCQPTDNLGHPFHFNDAFEVACEALGLSAVTWGDTGPSVAYFMLHQMGLTFEENGEWFAPHKPGVIAVKNGLVKGHNASIKMHMLGYTWDQENGRWADPASKHFIEQQAVAWEHVCKLLDEVIPEWQNYDLGNGMQKAEQAIRILASRATITVDEKVQASYWTIIKSVMDMVEPSWNESNSVNLHQTPAGRAAAAIRQLASGVHNEVTPAPEVQPWSQRDTVAMKAPIDYETALDVWGQTEPNLSDDATRAAFFAVWAMLRYEWADAVMEARAK